MEQATPTAKDVTLIVTIVDRGQGDKVAALYDGLGAPFHFVFLGRGTAKSEMLDHLGLGRTDKDIVLGSVVEEKATQVLHRLRESLHLDRPGHGIAFTLPVTSIAGPLTLGLMCGLCGREE